MKKINLVLAMILFTGLLSSCGQGAVSQEEYDRVVKERDSLQEQYDKLLEEYSNYYAQHEVNELKESISTEIEQNETLESREQTTDIPYDYYESGQYKVGEDIQAGEYILLAESDREGFFSVDEDANGNEIIFNGNFKTNTIVTVNDGEFFEFKRSIAVRYDDFYPANEIDISNDGIMIKVGNEIEPGEYKVLGERGYYCIYSDSRQDDIISNGQVDGSKYISVEDGQYLVLKKCTIQVP